MSCSLLPLCCCCSLVLLFSTDITATLCATDLHAQAVLKGTNVDAFYVCNSKNSGITFEHLSFRETASRGNTPMDMMALTFCEENVIPENGEDLDVLRYELGEKYELHLDYFVDKANQERGGHSSYVPI